MARLMMRARGLLLAAAVLAATATARNAPPASARRPRATDVDRAWRVEGAVRQEKEEWNDDELEPGEPKDVVVQPRPTEPVPVAVEGAEAETEAEGEEEEEEEGEEGEGEEDAATKRPKEKALNDQEASPEADVDEDNEREEVGPEEEELPSVIEDEENSGAGDVFNAPDDAAKNDAAGEKKCFPASANVTLKGGTTRSMSDLAVGDHVLVAGGRYSPVFMFTHRERAAAAAFVRVEVAAGRAVTATRGHYVFVRGRGMVAAGAVHVGELMMLAGQAAQWSPVVAVLAVEAHGLYNPQTVSGDIVVDGLVVSTYTTAVEPAVAHALLAPFRAAFRWLGVAPPDFKAGAPLLAGWAPSGAPVAL